MAEVRTEPVKSHRFDDIDEVQKVPGAFEYYKAGDRYLAGMIYCCPCGCGRTGALRFRPSEPSHPSWQWDGNMEAPTLTPSVHHVGHWHGWLTDGVWRSC